MNVRGYYGEGPIIAPPRVMATESPVMGFVVCPAMLQHAFLANCNVQLIYRAAYERARAAVRAGRYERLYRASCN